MRLNGILAIVLASALMVGCQGKGNDGSQGKIKSVQSVRGKKKSIIRPASTGNPYEVLVVASAENLQNKVYYNLMDVLEDDVPGLPQSESQFKVSKTTDKNYYRTLRFCRSIVMVNTDPGMYTQPKIKYARNVYSTPQIILTLQAPDAESLAPFIKENADVIADVLVKAELNNEIDRLKEKHSLVIQEQVQKQFGCDVWIPQELVKTKKGKDFFWASTDKGERDMNFVVYSFPYTDAAVFTPEGFFEKRDSVMQANIPGPREGQYMQTARPYVKVTDSEMRGRYCQVARGLWEMKDYDMGGPFISVSRVDEANQKVIVAEGFVYAPGDAKRNLMRRMEAAIYTLQLPDEIEERRFSYAIEEITIEPDNN